MRGARTAESKFSAENLDEPVPRPKVSDGELLSRGRAPSGPHMFLPTHLIAGLIIGKLTGDYTTSLIGSVIMDTDHLFVYYRKGILLQPKKFLLATVNKIRMLKEQRNIFHNIIFCLAASAIIFMVNHAVGLVFFSAYLCHLLLDCLDDSSYVPFYPNERIKIKGPIKYFSGQEIVFAAVLLIIFFLI